MIKITYFTDPYCSWCWATEPMLYRLRESYRDQISLRYVMGGLVKDMAQFHDSLNEIRTTAQVAPHWREVSERSGQPIDEQLMEEIADPHFSTWPACVAVKAGQLQGEAIGEAYLRRMRRAALTERKLISDPSVYLALARQVPALELERFQTDLESAAAQRAFHEDLAECRRYGVTGFPTLLFQRIGVALLGAERPILVGGHRSFDIYRQVLRRLAPHLEEHPPRDLQAILADRGPLTSRELTEVRGKSLEEMRAELEPLAAEGRIRRLPVHGGELWEPASATPALTAPVTAVDWSPTPG